MTALKNPLSLHHLTVKEIPPAELVTIAAALGCPQIGVFVTGPGRATDAYKMIQDEPTKREVLARMADTGVTVHNLEVFALRAKTNVEADFRRHLEMGAALGAKRATVQKYDEDASRALDNFRALCALGDEYGIAMHIEFTGFQLLKTPAQTLAFLDEAGIANATVAVDFLHVYRTGGTPADVAAIPPHRIGYIQINDGLIRDADFDSYLDEALEDRLIPGTGAFDLPALIAAMPGDVTIDVECPSRRLINEGKTPLERARIAVEASKKFLGSRV